LLVLNQIETKSHTATKTKFSLLFIKTGKINKDYGKLLSQLFDWRHKGDYENLVEYSKNDVNPLFEKVENMIKLIESEIHKSL
jgi:uncharacterized protein (UPF0332 family)